MNDHGEQQGGGGVGEAGSGASRGDRIAATTLAWTILTAALLAFASFAKFYEPQHEKELMDRGIASVQVLIIIGVLVFWRRWWTWGALAAMWTGMAAWSIWASANGAKCGCFGSLVPVPDFVSGTVDAMFALVSLSVALLRGAPRAMLAGIVVAMGVAWPAGWYGASTFVDPSNEKVLDDLLRQPDAIVQDGDAALPDEAPLDEPLSQPQGIIAPSIPEIQGYTAARTRLLESDLMADIREQEFGRPAWLIFVHDPDCHICEALMPYMDFMGAQWEESGDPVMQVRKFSIPDVRADFGIERHEWPDTPTIFVVRDGEIVAQWYGATADGWTDGQIQEIYDAFELDDPSLLPAEPQWKELEAIERNR